MTALGEAQVNHLPLWMPQAARERTSCEWWDAMRNRLRERLGPAMFERWFAKVEPIALDGEHVKLLVPSLIHLYWIEDNFRNVLDAAVADVVGGTRLVELLCPGDDALGSDASKETDASSKASKEGHRLTRSLLDSGLNSRFSFDSFVVGSNCSYSCAAARAVADKPGKNYNPLFLHGSAGLGKTHLMQAIGQEVLRQKPRKTVRYVTSEAFTNEYIDALRRGGVMSFRRKYRDVDVLLIDDVHFLGGKQSTQEEFFHTFNDLHIAHKQIVLASDRPPSEIANLEARLVSRFEWGLATQIQTPDLEVRSAILRQKMRDWTVPVQDWVLEFIAAHIQTNVRRLEGALMRVAAHISLGGAPLTEQVLETMLNDILEAAETRAISIDYIQKVVADHFDIRLADMTSTRRPKSIVVPRQIAMYLARQLTKNSLMDIGDAFGGRDHGTVIHACSTVTQRMTSEDFRRTISALIEKIKKI